MGCDLHKPFALDLTHYTHVLLAGEHELVVHNPARQCLQTVTTTADPGRLMPSTCDLSVLMPSTCDLTVLMPSTCDLTVLMLSTCDLTVLMGLV